METISSRSYGREENLVFSTLPSWAGRVSSTVFSFIFFISVAKVEVSEVFSLFFKQWEGKERRSHLLAVLWECADTSVRALCRETFCGRQERSRAL